MRIYVGGIRCSSFRTGRIGKSRTSTADFTARGVHPGKTRRKCARNLMLCPLKPCRVLFEDRDTRICSIFTHKNRTAGNCQNADIPRGFGHMSSSCSVISFENRTPRTVGTQRVEPICSVCSILLLIIIEKKYIRNYIKESFDLKSEQTEQEGKSELFHLVCIFGSS